MKRAKCVVGLGLLIASVSAVAIGQSESQARDPNQKASTRLNFSDPDGLRAIPPAQAYESVAPDTAVAAEPSPPVPPAVALESPVFADGPAGPWKLPQPGCFQHLGITVGGWIEQGITSNADGPADQFNGPNATNDRDHEYQLHQLWLYFVKPTKTDGDGFDIGGRFDMSYGTDWRFGQTYGLENRFDDPNSFYGLILPQFYGEVAFNDLTVKLGHFATMTSYEVIPAPLNFFYSHSLLSSGYFDPLLVTGMQAEYHVCDNLTLVGGLHDGWLMFEDPSGTWNFLGGARWTSDDQKSKVMVMVDEGPEAGFTGYHDRTSVIAVWTQQLSEKLQYASQYTIGGEAHGSVINPGANAAWFGTEQVLIYAINPKWSTGVRYEWVCDEQGSRVAGIGNLLLTDKGWGGQPGMAGSYHDFTIGVNYRPHPNFVFRPEVRWDHYVGQPNTLGQLPYGNMTRDDQFTFAVDMIMTY